MQKPFTAELNVFLKQIEVLPVTKLYRLDAILSDLSNYIHNIGEFISELRETAARLTPAQKKKKLSELKELDKEFTKLHNVLYKMGYDSHYMDRTFSIMSSVTKDLENLIKELEK